MTRHGERYYRLCPRCGQRVYRQKWEQHDRDCLSVVTRFGPPADLARLFRSEPDLQVADLVRQLPGVSRHVVWGMLRAGGVTTGEIARRNELTTDARARCARCTILLQARGVRPGRNDSTLCWWCDGTAPS